MINVYYECPESQDTELRDNAIGMVLYQYSQTGEERGLAVLIGNDPTPELYTKRLFYFDYQIQSDGDGDFVIIAPEITEELITKISESDEGWLLVGNPDSLKVNEECIVKNEEEKEA